MDSPDLLGLKESDPNVPDAKKLEPQVPDPKTADSKGKGKAIEPDLHDPKLSDPKGKGKAAHPEVAVPEGVTLEVLPTEKTLGSELADQDVLAQDKPASKVSGSMASDSKASGSKISDAKISHRKASKQKMRDPKVSCPVANPRDYFNCKEVSAETTIRSSWEFAQEVGEPNSLIRVRNIRTCIPLARDAWGRKAQRQPVIVSATAFLRKPFESASAEDAVTDGTVHYGKLSKAIAIASKAFADEAGTGTLDSHEVSLENFLDTTAIALTTMSYPYCETAKCETSEESEESEESGESRESEEIEDIKESENAKESKGIKESEESTKDILLHRAITNALELSIMLPKASLMGSGVSLTTGTVYYIDRPNPVSMCGRLTLHELRIPALIGVNSNERLAKQIVVANVEIDRWVGHVDLYNELEDIVVKESSFQTLEKLATVVAHRIARYFLLPRVTRDGWSEETHSASKTHRIRVSLEKPTAVTFADAPVVEFTLDTDPNKSLQVKNQYWKKRTKMKVLPPFPLPCRLDEWITTNDPEETD